MAYFLADISLKQKVIDLIDNVQIFFEVSADLQFKSAENECEFMTEDWIKFEDAMTNTLILVSSLTTECFANVKERSGLASRLRMEGFSVQEVSCLVQDLIIAAADTTSYSTLWSFHLLASNPSIQEKARNEVVSLNPDDDFSRENLKFLNLCNKESMRLYPVAPFLTRILNKPLRLSREWDENVLRKDRLILMSTYAMSRNDEYFENPDQFWPERWERIEGKRRGVHGKDCLYASLPFGHGARKCIGVGIAENQMAYFLGKLLQRFKFRSDNQTQVKYQLKFIGVPDRPILISLSKI